MTDRSLAKILDRVPGPILTLAMFLMIFVLVGPAIIFRELNK